MVDRNKLMGLMVSHGYNQKTFSKKLGVSENTFSSMMTGKRSPRIEEVTRICDLLGIHDAQLKTDIFLSRPSQK